MRFETSCLALVFSTLIAVGLGAHATEGWQVSLADARTEVTEGRFDDAGRLTAAGLEASEGASPRKLALALRQVADAYALAERHSEARTAQVRDLLQQLGDPEPLPEVGAPASPE